MDEMLTKAATLVTKHDTQISRVSNNNSIASSARTQQHSPRVDPMANRAKMSFIQKRNDADTVSVFSQAIESVRGTKGKALLRLKKPDTIAP